jgi:hypothetical protein
MREVLLPAVSSLYTVEPFKLPELQRPKYDFDTNATFEIIEPRYESHKQEYEQSANPTSPRVTEEQFHDLPGKWEASDFNIPLNLGSLGPDKSSIEYLTRVSLAKIVGETAQSQRLF